MVRSAGGDWDSDADLPRVLHIGDVHRAVLRAELEDLLDPLQEDGNA